MQNAIEIYQESIRQMPSFERLCLATLILEDLTEGQIVSHETKKQSAFELLVNQNGNGIFQTANEVDEYLKAEREAWKR